MTIARRIRVSGQVQGVFFRAWTKAEAERQGVTGWVRNLADGSVEAQAEGDEAAVVALVNAMRRGPRGARVDELTMSEAEPEHPSDFSVRH